MADTQTRDKIPVEPFHKKIAYAAAVSALQALVVAPASFIRDVKAKISQPSTAPDLIKTYPVRPSLHVR